jgi:hypothetical protein
MPPRRGELVHLEEGWALRGTDGDDAPVWRIEVGVMRPGEIVTVYEPDGERLLYRIVSVRSD